MQETQVRPLGWEDCLEKEMATQSSILAWRIPRTEEPEESACKVGDLSLIPGLGRFPWRRERLHTPVFWPGEFHGLYSLCGCKALKITE